MERRMNMSINFLMISKYLNLVKYQRIILEQIEKFTCCFESKLEMCKWSISHMVCEKNSKSEKLMETGNDRLKVMTIHHIDFWFR